MVMDAWEHLQTDFEFLGFWGWDGAPCCLLVCTVSGVLIAWVGHPYPRKTHRLEQHPCTLLLRVVSEQRGLQGMASGMQGSSPSRNLHVDNQRLFGSLGVLGARKPSLGYVLFFRRATLRCVQRL